MKNSHALASVMHEAIVAISPEKEAQVLACLESLCSHEHATQMLSGIAAHNGEDFWNTDSWQAAYRPYIVKDGILHVPVKGVLLHDFSYALGNYATGYYYIQKAVERGMTDPNVRGIALVVNSPGGQVAGCFELTDRLYEMRGQKPIRGFAHEHAYSAGYAVISAADHITVSKTGGVGSVGVVTMHVDYSKNLDANGIKITFIFAGEHKVEGNPYEPLGKEAKARIQARIDETYTVFVQAVARNRKMDEKKIREQGALTFAAKDAKDEGMVDSIGPFDEALADYSAFLMGNENGDEAMTKTAEQIAADQRAEAEANAKRERDDAVAKASADAVTAERARVAGIKGCDAAKTRPLAAAAFAEKSDLSVEAASALLAAMPEEPKAEAKPVNSFEKAMEKIEPGPKAEGVTGELTAEQKDDARAQEILAARFGAPKQAAK